MSIRTMSKVWECSQHSGSNLLMLLAVADFSDDDGMAFPAVEKLAKKCRMSKRNAQDRLRELSESGELTILKNQGPPPKYPNLFKVNLKLLGVKPTAPKPSVNRQEPSTHAHDARKQHRSRSPSASTSAEDGFANFWQHYPKKVAKPQALKAWKKIKPVGQVLADLMAGLEQQKASADWLKDGGQFIPHPSSWLNGRRWEDEAPPAAGQTAGPARNPIFAGAV